MLQVMKYDTEVESLSKQGQGPGKVYKLWHANPVFLFYFIITTLTEVNSVIHYCSYVTCLCYFNM